MHYLEINYDEAKAHFITDIRNQYNETVGAGITVYDGRVMVLPCSTRDYYSGRENRNHFRQEIIQKVLADAHQKGAFLGEFVFVDDAPFVTPYYYEQDDMKALVLVNSSVDDYNEVRMYAPGLDVARTKVLSKDSGKYEGAKEAGIIREDNFVVLKKGIKGMELKLLIF